MDFRSLVTAEQIKARLDALGEEIRADYVGRDPILVGVLRGALHFYSELSRRLPGEWRCDMLQVASWMGRAESSGIVQYRKDLDLSIEGEDVLLIEDIVDTGRTIAYLRENLATRRPRSLAVATLLSKPEARVVQVPVEYVGFEIPDVFVVGYGLDYADRYRGLPGIHEVVRAS